MNISLSRHANTRTQQRGVPPLIINWLVDYGDEEFDGHGGIVRYFSNGSLRRLEREIGRGPLKRMSEYLRCYLVQSSFDGTVVTVGKRYDGRHIWRH